MFHFGFFNLSKKNKNVFQERIWELSKELGFTNFIVLITTHFATMVANDEFKLIHQVLKFVIVFENFNFIFICVPKLAHDEKFFLKLNVPKSKQSGTQKGLFVPRLAHSFLEVCQNWHVKGALIRCCATRA